MGLLIALMALMVIVLVQCLAFLGAGPSLVCWLTGEHDICGTGSPLYAQDYCFMRHHSMLRIRAVITRKFVWELPIFVRMRDNDKMLQTLSSPALPQLPSEGLACGNTPLVVTFPPPLSWHWHFPLPLSLPLDGGLGQRHSVHLCWGT